MSTPTFIAAYNSTYNTSGSSKTVSVTTNPGDTLIVYGGGDTNGTAPSVLATPTGNSVSLTLLQSVSVNNQASAYIWGGTDTIGGTNWTLTCVNTTNSSFPVWGFTCVVFRSTGGIGASNSTYTSGNGTAALSLTTTQNNSAVVVFNNDWASVNGSSRVWDTVNGITPSAGNGLELSYTFNSGLITIYGAYYNNTGTAGPITVGLSAPTGQTYSIVAAEVLAPPGAVVAWLV